MRFKKMSKAEVMNKNKEPKSWCVARKCRRDDQWAQIGKITRSYKNVISKNFKTTEKRPVPRHSSEKVDALTFSRDPFDFDHDECSIGSCSVSGNCQNKFFSQTNFLSSDAESFNASRDEEEVAARIHSLELHAYRSTLEALYASGPLSWEKEALLTNLRINLHISNDEHSRELRHLISRGAGVLD